MTLPESTRFPSWAERERVNDMAWIRGNLHVLWPAARAGYEGSGRGALLIDTTSSPTGSGHPLWYAALKIVEQSGVKDAIRMVRGYEPSWEMVTVLFKKHERVSTYRIGVIPR